MTCASLNTHTLQIHQDKPLLSEHSQRVLCDACFLDRISTISENGVLLLDTYASLTYLLMYVVYDTVDTVNAHFTKMI